MADRGTSRLSPKVSQHGHAAAGRSTWPGQKQRVLKAFPDPLAITKEAYHPPHITTGETELKAVQQFTYLECTISSVANIDKEVDSRLPKAHSIFGRIYNCVWSSKHLNESTKISIYRAVALSTLLYGSESWVTYSHYLEHTHTVTCSHS